jgi:hypothetical protein
VIKGNLMEIGKIIKWMEKEYLFGLMEENIQDSIKTIKNMDMVYLNGMYFIINNSLK